MADLANYKHAYVIVFFSMFEIIIFIHINFSIVSYTSIEEGTR